MGSAKVTRDLPQVTSPDYVSVIGSRLDHSIALTTSSTTFLASPNTIIVLSM